MKEPRFRRRVELYIQPSASASRFAAAQGLAAPFQHRGWPRARPRRGKEGHDLDAERASQPLKHRDSRIFHIALKPTHVSPIDLGIHGKRLLCHAFFDAQAAKIPRDQLSASIAEAQQLEDY